MAWLKSKTVWGIIIAVLGAICSPEVLAVFPPSVAHTLEIVGSALTAFGFRSAVAPPPAPPAA